MQYYAVVIANNSDKKLFYGVKVKRWWRGRLPLPTYLRALLSINKKHTPKSCRLYGI